MSEYSFGNCCSEGHVGKSNAESPLQHRQWTLGREEDARQTAAVVLLGRVMPGCGEVVLGLRHLQHEEGSWMCFYILPVIFASLMPSPWLTVNHAARTAKRCGGYRAIKFITFIHV